MHRSFQQLVDLVDLPISEQSSDKCRVPVERACILSVEDEPKERPADVVRLYDSPRNVSPAVRECFLRHEAGAD
jgi:hypothetical protein